MDIIFFPSLGLKWVKNKTDPALQSILMPYFIQLPKLLNLYSIRKLQINSFKINIDNSRKEEAELCSSLLFLAITQYQLELTNQGKDGKLSSPNQIRTFLSNECMESTFSATDSYISAFSFFSFIGHSLDAPVMYF